MKINYEKKIFLKQKEKDRYEIYDKEGNILLSENEDYYIYFKNVNFTKEGMNGRFLGYTTGILEDGYSRIISQDDNGKWVTTEGELKTANMASVKNGEKTVVILKN